MHFLTAYPVATVSSALAYLVFILLLVPATSRRVAPWLTTPASTIAHLGAFDTIRGFAALLVAFSHFWWATQPLFSATPVTIGTWSTHGTKAVPIFAVLSGFLIYRSTAGISSLPTLRAYIIRRFFRIYPVYLVLLLIALPLGQVGGGQGYTMLGHFVAEVTMMYTAFWPPSLVNPPTWSVYVEVLFYALLPLLVVTVGRQRMVWVAGAGIVIFIVAWFPSPYVGLWKFFLAGILASELVDHFRKIAWPTLLLGVALLVIDFQGEAYNWASFLHPPAPGDVMTIGLGVAMFLILVSLPHLTRLGSALDWLPFKVLGAVSYSVYLVQFFYLLANFPEIGLMRNFGGQQYNYFVTLPALEWWYLPFVFLPGVIFWGMVSFILFEKPGMDLGRKLAKRVSSQGA